MSSEETRHTHQHYPDLDRDIFQWRDGQGKKHPLHDIDDNYLNNIIRLLERKEKLDNYRQAVLEFLVEEKRIRANDIF